MLLKSKQDAEEFVFWCVTLQCEVLPKGQGDLQTAEGYCCIGVGHACTVPENKQVLDRYKRISGILNNSSTKVWLDQINEDVMLKTGHQLWEHNDGIGDDKKGKSHEEIGTLLLKLYEDELEYWFSVSPGK